MYDLDLSACDAEAFIRRSVICHPSLLRDRLCDVSRTYAEAAAAMANANRAGHHSALVMYEAAQRIIARLAVGDAPTGGKAEEERAAIVEHDGNIPRDWAEGFARLDPDRPPGDVPLKRWRRFVDDVGQFLDSPFCAVAAALGWGPHDLFGCDRARPFARIDQEPGFSSIAPAVFAQGTVCPRKFYWPNRCSCSRAAYVTR